MATKERPKVQKRLSSFNNPSEPQVVAKALEKKERTKAAKIESRKAAAKISTNQPAKPNASKPSYSREVEKLFDKVLEGKFNELPPTPRSTVRIFLSSTFADMRAERNSLAKEAYPLLRDHCTSLGFGFQVVDLRWGVTSEATNNHLTTKICLTELENCKKVSLGPQCIALIGDRYGFRPLPYEIAIDEFDTLREEAVSLGLKDITVLDLWYIRDNNACPPGFFLQPVTSHLPNFLNESSGEEEKRRTDEKAWTEVEKSLLDIIHITSASAATKGKLSKERQHFYVMSVTEHEVRDGLRQGSNNKRQGLAFLRHLDGLDKDRLNDTLANRHKELITVDGQLQIDNEIQTLLKSLKTELSKNMKSDCLKNYTLDWQEGGIQPDTVESHRTYISQFCADFVNGIKNQIDEGFQENNSLIRQREWYSDYSETLHHAQFCLTKCQSFCGQKDVLDKIKGYVLDPTNRKPYIIHAKSGVGKTSVMAMAMNQLGKWITGEHYGMIRFLGTSPMSTNIYNVIFSVCGQLADIKELILEPHSYKTMRKLVLYFPRFLRTISNALKVPIVIFLDSLDQLESLNDAFSVNWLPTVLPQGVKIIISTLPGEHNILKNLKSVIAEPANFTEIHLLPLDTGRDIINKYFASKNRCLTPEQMSIIMNTVQKTASPLYLKLLMDQALTWTSFTPVAELVLPGAVRVAINSLFEKLEVKFGARCVQGALGLITVGLNGLSEIEVEDALSCLDDALIEIYKHHDPPVPGMVRVPPVLWARIRYDIQEYLVERQSQGVRTLFWYHRQFIEAAVERYTKGDKGKELHKVLFELLASENGVKRSIILTQRNNLEVLNADRNTTPQPTTPSNGRKLEAMTFHLKNCMGVVDKDYAKKMTYCCFKFLRAKVASVGAAKLLEEMKNFLDVVQDEEVKKMVQFVSLSQNSLRDPVIFAFKSLAYIVSEPGEENLEFLKTDTREYLMSLSKTLLIPEYPCLAPRHGEPEKVYDGLAQVIVQRNEMCLLLDVSDVPGTQSNADGSTGLSCVDFSTFELMKHICDEMTSKPFLSYDGKTIYYLSEPQTALIRLNVSNGNLTSNPLTEIFSPKIKPSLSAISRGDCCIAGSFNSKTVAISIGSKISVFNSSDFKSLFQDDGEATRKILDMQICQDGNVISLFTLSNVSDSTTHPGTKSMIQVWRLPETKPVVKELVDLEIGADMSALTMDNSYFICFGNKGDNSVIISSIVKSPSLMTNTDVSGRIVSMKMSPSEPVAAFQEGDCTIKFLDLPSTQFVKNMKHEEKIQTWSMNWEEDEIVVVGESNTFSVYNPNMEKIFTRTGNFGKVSTLVAAQNQMLMLTVDKKAKLWGIKEFFQSDLDSNKKVVQTEDCLSSQEDVLSFVTSGDNKELITAGGSRMCRVWILKDLSLLRTFDIIIAATKMLLAHHHRVVALDHQSKRVVVFDWNEGKVICNDLPEKVMDIILTKDRNTLYLLTLEHKPVLYQYDMKSNSSSKKYSININFTCLTCQMFLTQSERYAAFLMKHTPEDFQAIQTMRSKQGGKFPTENFNKRFVAVDLTQSSGVPFYALYNLAKIPHLGVTMESYFGNQMMLSTRRWIMYWDIPTGKCDQTLSKTTRVTKMYRPLWLGQQCVGSNNVVCMSDNHKYVAVGSQDGYVFIYEADTGVPVGQKAPSAKHSSSVKFVTFTSDSGLVASACTGGYIKLWQPSTGSCLFSISVGTELRQMNFSKDGKKLVAVTLADQSHVLFFAVQQFT